MTNWHLATIIAAVTITLMLRCTAGRGLFNAIETTFIQPTSAQSTVTYANSMPSSTILANSIADQVSSSTSSQGVPSTPSTHNQGNTSPSTPSQTSPSSSAASQANSSSSTSSQANSSSSSTPSQTNPSPSTPNQADITPSTTNSILVSGSGNASTSSITTTLVPASAASNVTSSLPVHPSAVNGTNPCMSQPCLHNGSCHEYDVSNMTSYRCDCLANYVGNNCQQRNVSQSTPDACSSSPCQHGGSCRVSTTDNVTQYECICIEGYFGSNCHLLTGQQGPTTGFPASPCESNPCQNNGTCLPLANFGIPSYQCMCAGNFTGYNCDENGWPPGPSVVPQRGDPCQSSPCMNNGRCLSFNSTDSGTLQYGCSCIGAYYGINCQFYYASESPCEGNPCQPGVCYTIHYHHFMCLCHDGFRFGPCQRQGIP